MPARESETRRLLRCRDAMDRDYTRRWDVPSLARLAFMSPDHFTRRFRRLFGTTPHRYLYRRRIERAARLLRTTRLPVTRIALESGYASLGTFTRTFHQVMGETPGAYRARGAIAAVPSCFLRERMPADRAVSEKPPTAPPA